VDPNVLVSAAISTRGKPRELLVAWYSGSFEMVVSYDLLYELEAVLLLDKFRSKLTVSDVLEYVLWIRERSNFVEESPVVAEVSPDPDDNYLYALALALMVSDFLASGDPHLLDLRGGPVRVVTPREFLEQI
jgi:uncharacterized protein